MMLRDGPCQAQMCSACVKQKQQPSLSSPSRCSAVARQVLILISYLSVAYSSVALWYKAGFGVPSGSSGAGEEEV